MTYITTESERSQAAIRFVQERIDNLRAEIRQCNYSEDVDGNPMWAPGDYSEEKQLLTAALREWERMLTLLQGGLPFCFSSL